MMQRIGDEMQRAIGALHQPSIGAGQMRILDLCMAPGGYTASALKYNPGAEACGITLPPEKGGHDVLLPSFQSDISFLDITMLAKEFGVENPPVSHPEQASFLSERPFLSQTFQLIFCDGQVLRKHERPAHREKLEASRLTLSQLILALQRIRTGGTLIMLLHKIDRWGTAELLYLFSRFSSVEVFKPKQYFAIKSSFYLVARNVQPNADAAKLAVERWKRSWWQATFGGENGTGEKEVLAEESYVHSVLENFGSELIKLSRPVWKIQADGLEEMAAKSSRK